MLSQHPDGHLHGCASGKHWIEEKHMSLLHVGENLEALSLLVVGARPKPCLNLVTYVQVKQSRVLFELAGVRRLDQHLRLIRSAE